MQKASVHPELRIGTRASPMAVAMAETAKRLIIAEVPTVPVSIHTFVAEGDKIKGSLQSYGGKGTFIKDLERRLLADEVDCAVHSLKDIPGDLLPHPDLALIAFLTREDPRDSLILRKGVTEDDLRAGGVIGSSSPRRASALARLYPASAVVLCRGNVNSRLAKLDNGEYDAIVLSYAGLMRLGLDHRVSRVFSPEEILPAVGQGIMVLQVRRADLEKCSYLKKLSDRKSEIAASAERAMLFRLQGNCHSAIAGYCALRPDGTLNMRGIVYDQENGSSIEAAQSWNLPADPEMLGNLVAESLIAQGAKEVIAA